MRPSRPIWQRLAPYVLLVLGWVALTSGNRWYVNLDAGVYASVATRLASGRFGEAILPYWSPLYPTLATPLVVVGVEPFMALRLVLLTAALTVIPTLRALCVKAGAGHAAADVAILAAVVLLLVNSVYSMHPDIVFLALALGCLYWLLTARTVRGAALAGFLGGCAYLAKAVALPYLLVLIPVLLLLRLFTRSGTARSLLKLSAVSLGALLLTSAGWIGLISAQAGYPTISTASAFNAELVQPGSLGNPLRYRGLYPLPEPSALTVWESPRALPIPRSAPAEPVRPGVAGALKGRVENTDKQLRAVAVAVYRLWLPMSLLTAVGLVVSWRRGGEPRAFMLGIVLAGAGFALGMALIIVIGRYLWLPMLCCVPAAALGLEVLARPLHRVGGRLLVGVAAAALVVVVATDWQSRAVGHWQTDREVWELAERLNADAPLTGPLAGSSGWRRSQLLGILTGGGYVGLAPKKLDDAELVEQLEAVGAKHLVRWPTRFSKPAGRDSPVIVEDVSDTGLVRHDGG